MNGEGAHEVLFDNDVLTTRQDGVAMTEAFASCVETYLEEVSSRSPPEVAVLVQQRLERANLVEPFVTLSRRDPRTVAELCALHEFLAPTSDTDWLSLVPPLRLFRQTDLPVDGVPVPFVPVEAQHVPPLLQIFSPAVVYVWRHDCTPCDAMKDDLESVFQRDWGGMPFAVYGPDNPEFLASEYEVTAGPALLFVLDGIVQSRLYGAHGPETLKSELAFLKQE